MLCNQFKLAFQRKEANSKARAKKIMDAAQEDYTLNLRQQQLILQSRLKEKHSNTIQHNLLNYVNNTNYVDQNNNLNNQSGTSFNDNSTISYKSTSCINNF